MKRILLMVFRNILLVPYMWIKLCHRAAHPENYTLEEHVKFLKWIVFRANKGGNVKIEEHGAENLPKENGFMFFPNHQGMYDVLAILDACPYPFSVVAKKEVKDVPFLKQVFSCMHAYMIDREDIRQSMQVIIDVSKEVIDAVIRNGAVYFAAVGGAGALLSKCITKSEVVAYDDLGTEAIRKLQVENFPVIVVIDSEGNNLYESAIKEYCTYKNE